MAYKQPSSGLPFKQIGSSPVKQRVSDLPKGFNVSGTDTWVEESKKILNKNKMPKNFNMGGKDKWIKQSKAILKKSGKHLSTKALTFLGLLMANDAYSSTDQPVDHGGSGSKVEPMSGEEVREISRSLPTRKYIIE